MKIDRSKLKKSTSEVPADCKILIEKIKACSLEDLLTELKQVKSPWTYGKCELLHWADVLDIFDEILDKACKKDKDTQWALPCDLPGNEKEKEMLLQVLQFTALLIEHSFTRHLYNSMEHLTTLLSSSDMTVVLGVLNLLYVFSKRSNFITRLSMDKKQGLVVRLTHLAESWGGKENGFGLAECCQDLPLSSYPSSATTLHFEFYAESKDDKKIKKASTSVLSSIHIENVDKSTNLAAHLMEELMAAHNVPVDKQMLLFTHIRLAQAFSKYEKRLHCVQARLQAISVLVYSNAMQDNVNTLLYNGFIEELVDILEVKNERLMEIKATALRTLTSIIHLDRNPRLNNIIDATGAASYHGFLPVLVRTCIQHMTEPDLEPFFQPFATALFSFLYHLASYENGGEALVSCGMMESLLKVINWFGDGQDHITFVTRAVRVVDLITNLDMQAFQSHGGLSAFINRLEHEVDICSKEQPFVIRPKRSESVMSVDAVAMSPGGTTEVPMETESGEVNQGASTSAGIEEPILLQPVKTPDGKVPQCFSQRAALLKSMLNFLKKAIPEPAFSDSIRHLMDGSLPRSLKHIISNAEYYGPSLFLLATDVVTVYVFQEPSLLSSLQDNGLTDVVLQALLVKDVPATREVLASLPNVFSALCLNNRGLEAFVQCKPFDRLFKVLLSPDYLTAMRRRRSSDPPGDTASSLGSAMDELMRHQPSLRTEATKAIIKLLEEVCAMGRDKRFVCQKPQPKSDQSNNITVRTSINNEATSSDDEDEEDDVASTHSGTVSKQSDAEGQPQPETPSSNAPERTAIPLMDYVLNVMKFVEAILSNNTTDDHCREFVAQKGLVPLMGILGLPNLPVDFPASPSCAAVASVCKSVLTLSLEPQVLKQGLIDLDSVLSSLEPLHRFLDPPGGSVLLRELSSVQGIPDPTLSSEATPLLHALSAAHAYINMFTHVCKIGQSDIRSISVSHWGSDLGLQVLKGLSMLYTSLVWESTVLLAFCSEDILPAGCEFGKADLEKILPKDLKDSKTKAEDSAKSDSARNLTHSAGELGSNGVSAAMESLSTSENPSTPMETEETAPENTKKGKMSPVLQAQIKQIKPLLSASSRLGRALAELFGLLVRLSVGSPVRQRRTQQLMQTPTTPTAAARAVATSLTNLLSQGLSWSPPDCSPVPKLRLTFFICSVGFTSPMLFDEKKYPYHLMLQKFVSCGGQDSLFEAFRWALSCGGKLSLPEGLESEDLPDGTGEFLDAWLMLVEKMVNTKNVLESPHTLPSKSTQPGFVPFNSLQYLIRTHKMAFTSVMHLWNKKPLKVYGGRMSESILAILCHIIKGEAVIKEKLEKERAEAEKNAVSNTASATTSQPTSAPGSGRGSISVAPPREEPEINADHLQQLMDMGFTREHASDALLHTTSLEQATDYVLTHPPPVTPAPAPTPGAPAPAPAPGAESVDLDSEEVQMMRAIAMSLGQSVVVSSEEEQKPKEEKTKEEEEEERDRQKEEPPLENAVLDDFTCVSSLLPGCMQLLDTLPESVYRVCDLLVVVTARNGSNWRDEVLKSIVEEIAGLCLLLIEKASPLTTGDKRSPLEWANQLSNLPEASKLAVRLHLLSLLFEEMKMPCAACVENSEILDLLVRLLDAVQGCLVVVKDACTPKWVAPLLLLLDLYEKMAVVSKRKHEIDRLVGKNRAWKWFDDRSGRWSNYSASNNKTIDDAYQAGESSVRFTAGRRRYNVQFSSMVQVNEDTGNRRPIMLSLPAREDNNKEPPLFKDLKKEKDSNSSKLLGADKDSNKMEVDDNVKDESKQELHVCRGLSPDQVSSIIRSAVGLISYPVDPDTLHAVMRLTLRLTREHRYALMFAEQKGPRLLLSLTQASSFQGFTSLATLILRHVLEESKSLKHTLEKVVRSSTSGAGSSMSGVDQGSMGSKEMHYILRVLCPAACRNPELFKEVAAGTLRIALPPPKREEDELRLTNPATPQLLKCVPNKTSPVPILDGTVRDVVVALMDTLIVKYNWKTADGPTPEVKTAQTLAEAIQEVMNEVTREITERQEMLRQDSNAEIQGTEGDGQASNESVPSDTTTEVQSAADKAKEAKLKEENEKKQRPLMPKSAIMRLLAELIRSYAGCANLITQYTYNPAQSELISEECSFLAFILDNLLHQSQDCGDKDCPALARVVIASIAACNHSPDAQTALVTEIKGALQRAVLVPESTEKHSRIQGLSGIISTIIEACPVPGQMPNQVFKGQQTTMNNMVKILLKKGLVTDLARIPHSLDLSSPSMASSVNAALKPLETLSRIVNQPQTIASTKATKQKPAEQATSQGIVVEPAANNPQDENRRNASQEENAQSATGEVHIEEVTDANAPEEELEEVVPLPAVEPVSEVLPEGELEDVLDELLQRSTNPNPEEEILGEIIMESGAVGRAIVESQEFGSDLDGDHDNHDSQMVTQDTSDDEAENTQGAELEHDDGTEGEDDEDDDDDDDNDSDEDDEDDDEGDCEVGDDECEEDEDEGSDMEADEDDMPDLEDDTFYRLNDDDLMVQLGEMLPPTMGGNLFGGHQGHVTVRTLQPHVVVHDADNGNEIAGPSVPPAPGNVSSAHPLLVRHAESHSISGSASRVHRTGRQRGPYRYNPSTQTLHVTYNQHPARHANPPAILQRLLGSNAADMLQLAGSQARFHFVANDDMRFMSGRGLADDDMLEDLFHDPLFDGDGSSSGVLSGVPSALNRWTEEARVLDGDSMHDCMTILKPIVIAELERVRDAEISERREKLKKTAEEEAARKEKEKKETNKVDKGDDDEKDRTIEWQTPGNMEVSEGSGATSSTAGRDGSNPEQSTVISNSLLHSLVSEPLESGQLPLVGNAQRLINEAWTSAASSLPSSSISQAASGNPGSVGRPGSGPPPVSLGVENLGSLLTPAQQTINLTTPSAPVALRNIADHPESPIDRVENTPMLLSGRGPSDVQMETSTSVNPIPALPMDPPARIPPIPRPMPTRDISEDSTGTPPSSLSDEPQTGVVVSSSQGDIDAGGPRSDQPAPGDVTPEQPSDITSSDAVTINSSGNSSENPSIAEIGTPSSEQASSTLDAPTPASSTTTTSAAAGTSTAASTSGESRTPNMFGDIVLPEGVDPSFLAALPDSIRQEVIDEQMRLQRIQQRAQQDVQQLGVQEVNPEFLAALPPNIQEEVLAQQRAEQQRQQQTTAPPNPEIPVDPAGFIATLPPSLRQQVLADMDDSMVAVLPPDMAAEAILRRREEEERHRRIMQERLFAQGAGLISGILRHSGLSGRLGTSRYAIRPPTARGGASHWGWVGGRPPASSSNANTVRLRGRHLLDHEALTCLLVLLFVDEPKLNTTRLHRVLRNLCYHGPTRTWVIRALLSILQRTSECSNELDDKAIAGSKSGDKLKKKSSQGASSSGQAGTSNSSGSSSDVLVCRTPKSADNFSGRSGPTWLSVSLDAALGCRANVFQIYKSPGGKKHAVAANSTVTIHPQASPIVCRHVLDTLISLAKCFPSQFLPQGKDKAKESTCDGEKEKDSEEKESAESKANTNQSSPARSTVAKTDSSKVGMETDFWELLVRLDNVSSGRKGKGYQRSHSNSSNENEAQVTTFESSPLGHLMSLLAHPVVRRSQVLTDRLLRLLGLVSNGLPDVTQNVSTAATSSATTTASAVSSTAPTNTSTATVMSTTTVASHPANPREVSMSEPGRQDDTLSESMDISAAQDVVTSTPLPGKKDEKAEESKAEEKTQEEEEEDAVLEHQLKLAVEVLTSKSCSEEGLEDATNLLLQLSRANNATRDSVLRLLLGGARHLGLLVCSHIRKLLHELHQFAVNVDKDSPVEEQNDEPLSSHPKGMLHDRFGGQSIVINAPTKIKGSGRELQLPSMLLLTSKTSNQQFFLRMLKVIIQLREAARNAAKKSKRLKGSDIQNIAEAMALLEAEAGAIMDMVSRRERLEQSDRAPLANADSNDSQEGESSERGPTPMDVDGPSTSEGTSEASKKAEEEYTLPRLSEQLCLEELWETLGECLTQLAKTPDNHAVLVLQPAVEAFFIVHAGEKDSKKKEQPQQRREDQLAHINVDITAPMSPAAPSGESSNSSLLSRENSVQAIAPNVHPDTQKFLKFADTHRTVLNQILRQSTTPLADGPFSVLVDHTRVLDFDVKRRYFRQDLERMDEGLRREDLAIHVRREHVFEDSFRELHRRNPDEWKHRFYIVFEGEEGQDAGGLLREWYIIISREIFNPMYALFSTSAGDRVTYTINPASHCNTNHLSYFKFVGRIIAKAIYDNKLLECYFTRSFYKHILGVLVKYNDMESEDYAFYQGLVFLLENNVADLGYDLTFATEIQEFGVTETRDLKPNGHNIKVTEENKKEYVKLVCQMKMTGAIRQQLNAFLEGFYDIIPKRLISIFNEQELELLISGLPTIDIDDLKGNTEYHKYQATSLQIQWFWRALRSFDQAERACFLQFVTGTSKVPLQGFAFLEGMNGIQKFQIHKDDRSTDRLPCAHTCFNQLDLPAYETYDKLRKQLLTAVHECSEGFGLA